MSDAQEAVMVERCDRHTSQDGRLERCCYAAEVARLRNRATLVDGMRETERAMAEGARSEAATLREIVLRVRDKWVPALLRDAREPDKTDCNAHSILAEIVRVLPGAPSPVGRNERFSPTRLDVHSPAEFQAALDRAGRVITCSWFIGAIRHRSDMKWVPVIIFADEDGNQFSYAFELRGGEPEIAAFNKRLRDVQLRCTQG